MRIPKYLNSVSVHLLTININYFDDMNNNFELYMFNYIFQRSVFGIN